MISQSEKKARIQEELRMFGGGTSAYYRWSPTFPYFLLTDGAHYVAKELGAYWLIDTIASHQVNPTLREHRYYNQALQGWKLTVTGSSALLVGDIGEEELISQYITYTDFPLDEIRLLVGHTCISSNSEESEIVQVCYLPIEH